MVARRRFVEFEMSEADRAALQGIARSRSEKAGRALRARMLLAYRENPSFYAVGRRLSVAHQTVTRCVERARDDGVIAALDERPRPGKEPTITSEAKAWLVSLACDKAKDHGYPQEIWTTRLLTQHAQEHCGAAGHDCLSRLSQGTLCKILAAQDLKPHKLRYYLERRDPDFAEKMAEVLCVYREVALLREADATHCGGKGEMIAILSYDEKPGIQALGTTAPDLPPVPGKHQGFGRDHEYVRHGTLSLLAGIDLVSGKLHARLEERHRSREFVEFLKQIDAAYPCDTAIKLILDNHSAHISKETNAWLAQQPEGRFEFVFTPKHGSWLNLIEGFFSKMARSMLRHIRVTSKQELKDRIMAYLEDLNQKPVIHKWTYKLNAQKAA
jgi:transposase